MPDTDHASTPEPASATPEAAKVALVKFLLSLTDARVKFERAPFDHPEIIIPLDGTAPDNTQGRAAMLADPRFRVVPAIGAAGNARPLPAFLGVTNTSSADCVTQISHLSSMGVVFRKFGDIPTPGATAFGPPSAVGAVRPLLPDCPVPDGTTPLPAHCQAQVLPPVDATSHTDPIPLFQGLRRVERRNTANVFAAFNFDNFWDGRARHDSNGGSVFGPTDPQFHVYINNGTFSGTLSGATNGHFRPDLRVEDPEIAAQPVAGAAGSTEAQTSRKPTGTLIFGEITGFTVRDINDPASGGRLVVGGKQITVPETLLIGLPSGQVPLRDLMLKAPAECKSQKPPQSGLAVSDSCRGERPPALARVVASLNASGKLVASVVMIQKDSGRTLACHQAAGRFAGAPVRTTTIGGCRVSEAIGNAAEVTSPSCPHAHLSR